MPDVGRSESPPAFISRLLRQADVHAADGEYDQAASALREAADHYEAIARHDERERFARLQTAAATAFAEWRSKGDLKAAMERLKEALRA